MKAPKDLALLTPDCLPCAQPDPPPSHPAEVRRPIKSRRWLQCNIYHHGQAQFFRVCDIVATVPGRHDPVLTRFPGPVQGSAAAGGNAAKGIEAAGPERRGAGLGCPRGGRWGIGSGRVAHSPSLQPRRPETMFARTHRVGQPKRLNGHEWPRFPSILDRATVFGGWEESSGKSRMMRSDPNQSVVPPSRVSEFG